MPKINVKKPFAMAEDGINVIQYGTGEHEVSEYTAEVAIREKWATPAKQSPQTKDMKSAPENK